MRWFLPLAAVVLFSCNKDKVEVECDEETRCPYIGEVCVEGQCQEFRCATSTQCPMESYCSGGDCLPGCVEDGDCYTGYVCDPELNVCEKDACADTQVDCGYREFCNTATGDCYDAGSQYCRFCDEDSECGEDNICYAHYCGVDCSDGQECPGGFECAGFTDEHGNIVTYQCFTYCWLYEDYAPGSFYKGLKPIGPLPLPESPVDGPPAEACAVIP